MRCKPLLPGRGCLDFVAFQFEQGLQRLADFGFVIDDENRPGHRQAIQHRSSCAAMTAASDIDGLPGQRKIQVERRPLAGAALHANLARVFLDDSVGNRQAQPGTALLAFLAVQFWW